MQSFCSRVIEFFVGSIRLNIKAPGSISALFSTLQTTITCDEGSFLKFLLLGLLFFCFGYMNSIISLASFNLVMQFFDFHLHPTLSGQV